MSGSTDTEIQGDDDRERSRQLSLLVNKPPAEIEGYSIVRRLGTGAYGTVWLAREDRTGRMVAIKFYPHRRGLNWSMLSREVEKLAAVYTSRNIVRLLDVGWNAEPPYFVMEFVENGSLGNHLARGALSVDESIRIIREICSALIDAHGAGVLHCDLKPDNVLLDGQLHARLCDFGQSRMSHEQSPALGTLYYMAPEQADLEALPDARWDVYAVGALLYHMLTGSPPHRNESTQKLLESAQSLDERLRAYQKMLRTSGLATEHRRIRGVDRWLAEIVDRCLAVIPGNRLPNAQAVRDELDARDRQRARRPLLMLGVVAPVLLMAAMVPIFVNALNRNLEITEQQLTTRALESDALSARLQAAALEHELDDRLDELETILSDTELAGKLEELMQRSTDEIEAEMRADWDKPMEERKPWMQLLDMAWERANASNERRNRGIDTSWFLNDRAGFQIWRRDFSERTIGNNFAYRDYFHGRGLDFEPDRIPEDIAPLTKRHVSIAYKSTTTDRLTVALSVPVRNSVGEVIGVFARSAHLGDLQSRLGQRMNETDAVGHSSTGVERFIALAQYQDSGGLGLLDHPLLTEAFVRAAEAAHSDDELFGQLTMDEATVAEIRQQLDAKPGDDTEVKLERYRDPVERLDNPSVNAFRGDWMAAMAPVQGTGWMVIVQEQRDAALKPVKTMAERASRQAWLAVLVAVALMAVIWFFVWRAFTRAGAPRSVV